MIFKSHVTMDSPRAVREMLKTLGWRAGERETYAIRSTATLEQWRNTTQPEQAGSTRARLENQARIDRSKADTARHLLIEAWVAAGYDDDGRQWISWAEAEQFADAVIKIVLTEDVAATSRLGLDDVFTGVIEVEVS